MTDKKTDAKAVNTTASNTTASKPDAAALFARPLVLQIPYSGTVVRDIPCGRHGQVADIYYPAERNKPVPVVVLITGYPDPGFRKMTGMLLKEVRQNQDWGRLLAASGMAAIAYTAAEPVRDALEVIDWIGGQGAALGIDPARLGVLSLSGNVPNALHVLQNRPQICCAALCYGFMLDTVSDAGVSAAAAQFHFVNPNSTTLSLATELALLVVRAGQDGFPGLNASIDIFVAQALRLNLDLELVNFPQGVHAFDIQDHSDQARHILRRIVEFYQRRLLSA